jgi:predicted dehydrogenase
MRYFCGEVKSVSAISITSQSRRGYENEDLASVILNFDNGVVANMTVSDSVVSPWSWETSSNENSEFPNSNQLCYLIGGSEGSLSIPELKIWKHQSKPDWTKSITNEKIFLKVITP